MEGGSGRGKIRIGTITFTDTGLKESSEDVEACMRLICCHTFPLCDPHPNPPDQVKSIVLERVANKEAQAECDE